MRCSRSRFLSAIAAAGVAVLATSLWTGRADAYCQEGTIAAPPGYDPTAQGCIAVGAGASGGLPMFWRNKCVSYSLQRNASQQIALVDAKRVAASAFAAWTGAQCPTGGPPTISVFQYTDVDCDSTPSQQHNNVIMFRDDSWPHDDSTNAIGYTTITADTDTGEMLGADIEINTFGNMIVPDAPAPLGEYDLGSILTHEAGHFLGLAHSADSTAIMYAFYKPGSTTLQPDDVNGICSIYDPSGTRDPSTSPVPATECHPEPAEGFLSECGSTDAGAMEDGQASDDATDPAPPCPDASSCSIGSRSTSVPGGTALCGLAVLGAFACRRARRRRARSAHRTRTAGTMVMVSLALAGAGMVGARSARASVSAAVLFEELVEGATAVAVVVPVEQRAIWENNRIVTYTRMQLDRPVAGQIPREIWVATHGGVVGHIVQIVEGEPTFALEQPSLVFLRPHVDLATGGPTGALVVVERAQGQFPIAAGDRRKPELSVAPDIGALLAPAPAHWARASQRLPAGHTAHFARDVLVGRPLDEAVREIAAAWPQTH
jgi:Matrixin